MNQKEITKLALKISGIYVLVQAIFYIPGIISAIMMLNNPGDNGNTFALYGFFIAPLLLLILGLFLVFIKISKSAVSVKIGSDLMTVGLAVAGVMVFVTALAQTPVIVTKLIEYYTAPDPADLMGMIDPFQAIMEAFGSVIQLAIGALFFFKAKSMAKLVK